MTASIESEILEALAGDPALDRDVKGDAGEREAAVDSFEEQTGFVIPAHIRWLMINLPGLTVRPRMLPMVGHKYKGYLDECTVKGSHHLHNSYESMTEFHLDYVDTALEADYVKQLVPLLTVEPAFYSLDYAYDANNPPIVSISVETGWGRGKCQYVASSILELLGYEQPPEGTTPAVVSGEPTPEALAWTEWFEQTILEGYVDPPRV